MSEKFTVTAPVATFNGDVAALVFRDGKATADSRSDARALAYCRRHGYGVEPVEGSQTIDDDRPKTTDVKADWVAYAVKQGATEDDADAMTKADLVAKYGTKGSSDE